MRSHQHRPNRGISAFVHKQKYIYGVSGILLAASLGVANDARAAGGKTGPSIQAAFSKPEHIDNRLVASRPAKAVLAPTTYSSLPLQLLVHDEKSELSLRQLPLDAQTEAKAKLGIEVQGCHVELTTGELALREYAKAADGALFPKSDAVLTGATIEAELGDQFYISMMTDLKGAFVGDAAAVKRCADAVLAGAMPLGQIGIIGSRIEARGADGQAQVFHVNGQVKTQLTWLMRSPDDNGFVVVDDYGLTVSLESEIQTLFAAHGGYLDVKIQPELKIVASKSNG